MFIKDNSFLLKFFQESVLVKLMLTEIIFLESALCNQRISHYLTSTVLLKIAIYFRRELHSILFIDKSWGKGAPLYTNTLPLPFPQLLPSSFVNL